MKFKKYINEKRQVKDFINKFKMKMDGSSLETAINWIDGIGEIGPKEKAQILKGIHNYIGDKNINQSAEKKLRKELQWYNNNF